MELTDADLVARLLVDDDQHAFGELVRRHQSSVRGLLRQLTRTDFALADDLAQEAFLKAYKNIRSFRGEAKFSTWLYRIAYNVFREDARRRKELVGIDENQLEAEPDPQTVDPALRQDLMHALSLLPLHERSAVLLCCQNGLSHDEAARVLDIPLGTVKTNVLRGREKLKKTLAAWGDELMEMNDDILDKQLRDCAPYIDDAGFTRRVLQSLPPAQKHQAESFRAVILLSITLLGSVLAYLLSDGGRFISQGMMRVASWSPLMLMILAIGTGVFMTGAGVAAAVVKQRESEA